MNANMVNLNVLKDIHIKCTCLEVLQLSHLRYESHARPSKAANSNQLMPADQLSYYSLNWQMSKKYT